MTIKFRCPQCNKLLSAPKAAAGKKAKCPSCENVVPIPAAESAAEATPPENASPSNSDFSSENSDLFGLPPVSDGNLFDDFQPEDFQQDSRPQEDFESDRRGVPDNPFQPPSVEAPLMGGGTGSPTGKAARLALGDVFSRGWAAYSARMGICIGAALVVWLLNVAFGFCFGFLAVSTGIVEDTDTLMMLMIVPLLLFVLWLTVGQALIFLGVARGAPVTMDVLFSGGRFILPIFFAYALFLIGVMLGIFLLILPGIFFALAFSQCFFLILDRDLGVIEAFRESMRITSGNRLTLFAIMFLLSLLSLPSMIPFVGFIYSILFAPFPFVILAVAYLRMTGQRVGH